MAGPIPLTPSLVALTADASWTAPRDGRSGAQVFRVERAGEPAIFVKYGAGRTAGLVADEFARLEWLRSRIAAPMVERFERSGEAAWLVTRAAPGISVYDAMRACAAGRSAIIAALAAALREIHALNGASCPFTETLARRLIEARANIDAGRVDGHDFDAERAGLTPEEVWSELMSTRPPSEDIVVAHGDFALDNVIIDRGAVSAILDLGRAGLADRYQDLAIAWRGLGEFGPEAQARFLSAYGVEEPDEARLRFYRRLDEFF